MKLKLKKYARAVERTAEHFPAYIRKPKAISHCALYAGYCAALMRNGEILLYRWQDCITISEVKEEYKRDKEARYIYIGSFRITSIRHENGHACDIIEPRFARVID